MHAGLLDGKKATSNKMAFDWVKAQSVKTDWVRHARWVEVHMTTNFCHHSDVSLAMPYRGMHTASRLYQRPYPRQLSVCLSDTMLYACLATCQAA